MNTESVTQVQQSVLKSLISWFIDPRELDFIDFPIFWTYQKIYETIKKIPLEEIKVNWMLHNEFVKLWQSKKIIEIMWCEYYSHNIYKDIEYICKYELVDKDKWVDELLLNFQKLENIRVELFKKMSWWESRNYNISNVLSNAYDLSLIAKEKKWLLWYSTWIKTLDKYTDWLQKGTLMRLTAYSNIGKSKLSYHICNSLLDQWAKVLYFSLEVKKEFVMYNLICNRYWLDFSSVARWCWHDMDLTQMSNKDLEIVDDKYNLSDLVLYTESRKPDAVIIDFVQNIRTDKSSEYESMTDIAISLQQMAIKNNIAVFDLSQISNDWASYELGWVIKSKWSWALVASADIWLVMQREKETNHNLLYIAKNKFWTNTKCIALEFDFWTGRIYDHWEHLLKSLKI